MFTFNVVGFVKVLMYESNVVLVALRLLISPRTSILLTLATLPPPPVTAFTMLLIPSPAIIAATPPAAPVAVACAPVAVACASSTSPRSVATCASVNADAA